MAPKRAWQRMLSGRRLNLLDPSPLDIEIDDIAHGLARVARWNGQTYGNHAYSVAEHSVLVLTLFDRMGGNVSHDQRLAALLHDASEYVIGDMISPFKAVIGNNYRETEERIQAAIMMRFGIAGDMSPALKKRIKQADRAAAHLEAEQLAGFSPTETKRFFGTWPTNITPQPKLNAPLSATDAKALLIRAFEELY